MKILTFSVSCTRNWGPRLIYNNYGQACETVTITSIIVLSCSGDFETTPASSAYSMPHSDVAGAGSPAVVFPRSSAPAFYSEAHQGVHDTFVTAAKKGLFHGEPPRVHAVVEPHACPHAIVD